MRSQIITLSRFFIPLLLLAGCTSSLQELKTISPVAEDFSGSLAAEYLAYSESEAEQGHSSASEYFASKGLRASKGEAVEPDAVKVKEGESTDISTARAALMEVLSEGVKKAAPQKAARAQMLFDCWNEQESDKLAAGAACDEEFSSTYEELRSISDNLLYGADRKNTIRFFEGSAELDDEEQNIIKEIVSHIAKHKDYKLQLKTYNDADKAELSAKRLVAVRDALRKYGIPKGKISFAKLKSNKKSGMAVYLSNDEAQQNMDIVEIIVTSKQHFLNGLPNE